ncbi:MAG: GNAT family N-acetyltransferase [Spirochaetia bacterium]
MFVIRSYQDDDFDPLLEMHAETVRAITSREFSPQQLDAWATKTPADITSWRQALSSSYTVVAESQARLVGMANLFIDQGYVDRLYVHKDFQRKGIAHALYMSIEEEAIKSSIPALTVEAAASSRPFFEKMGFTVISEYQKKLKNTSILNYVMTKTLPTKE